MRYRLYESDGISPSFSKSNKVQKKENDVLKRRQNYFNKRLDRQLGQVLTRKNDFNYYDPELAKEMKNAKNHVLNKFSYLQTLGNVVDIIEAEPIGFNINSKGEPVMKCKPDIGTAATDDIRIFYNPVWVRDNCSVTDRLGKKSKVLDFYKLCFLYMHELLHMFWNHALDFNSWKNKTHRLRNIATDIVIDNYIHFHSDKLYTVVDIHKEFIYFEGKDDTNINLLDSNQVLLLLILDLNKETDLDSFNLIIKKYNLNRKHVMALREWIKKGDEFTDDVAEKGEISDSNTGDDDDDDDFGNGNSSDDDEGEDDSEDGDENANKDPNKDAIDRGKEDARDAAKVYNQKNQGKGSGDENSASADKLYKLNNVSASLDWSAGIRQFLSQNVGKEFAMYNRKRFDDTGVMMRQLKDKPKNSFNGGHLLVFLDTSGSITQNEYNTFLSVLAEGINANNNRTVEIIPFSVGIHLDGKIDIKINSKIRKEVLHQYIMNFTKNKGLKSKGGNAKAEEIFEYSQEILGKYKSTANLNKLLIFTDGGLFQTPVKKSIWSNIKDNNVLWIIYDGVVIKENEKWFGIYKAMKNSSYKTNNI